MAAVIDGGSVHENQVLIDATAAYAETGGSFAGGLYARHHLDHPDDIGLTHEGGHLVHKLGVHPFQAHLGKLNLVPLGPGKHRGGLQFILVQLQVEIQVDRLPEVHHHLLSFIAEIRATNGMASNAGGEGIETESISRNAR